MGCTKQAFFFCTFCFFSINCGILILLLSKDLRFMTVFNKNTDEISFGNELFRTLHCTQHEFSPHVLATELQLIVDVSVTAKYRVYWTIFLTETFAIYYICSFRNVTRAPDDRTGSVWVLNLPFKLPCIVGNV